MRVVSVGTVSETGPIRTSFALVSLVPPHSHGRANGWGWEAAEASSVSLSRSQGEFSFWPRLKPTLSRLTVLFLLPDLSALCYTLMALVISLAVELGS